MRLRSGLTQWVKDLAGGSSSDSTPSLGTSECCRRGPKKQTKEKSREDLPRIAGTTATGVRKKVLLPRGLSACPAIAAVIALLLFPGAGDRRDRQGGGRGVEKHGISHTL